MTTEYTPTTEDIKESRRGGWHPDSIPGRNADTEFDRWLAEHDRETRAKAAEATFRAANEANVLEFKPSWGSNERDQEIIAFGEFLLNAARDHAVEIREGRE